MEKGLTIREAAERYAISIDRLLRYELVGLLLPLREAGVDERLYAADDLARIEFVLKRPPTPSFPRKRRLANW